MKRTLAAISGVAALVCLVYVAQVSSLSSATAQTTAPKLAVTKILPPRFPDQFADHAAQAVFMVKPYTQEHHLVRRGGTGFLLETPTGQIVILTNRHLCEMETLGDLFIIQQGEIVYVTNRLAMSEDDDLCVLAAPIEVAKDNTRYKLSNKKPKRGDKLAVFGHPHLRPLTETVGKYINEITEPANMPVPFVPTKVITMACADFMIFSGNSGSPVIDEAGKVVGIIFAYEVAGRMGLYVPTKQIARFLNGIE